MDAIWADAVAVLAIASAIGHSTIGEKGILGPLYREDQRGLLAHRSMRHIIRAVWHIPSVTWATLGLAVLTARLAGGDFLLSVVAVTIFAASGLGNLVALRRPHFGGLMLVAAAGLTAADWYLNL